MVRIKKVALEEIRTVPEIKDMLDQAVEQNNIGLISIRVGKCLLKRMLKPSVIILLCVV